MKATEREKAVIFALAAGYIDTWQKAFILSRDYPIEQAQQIKSLNPTVTRWKQREDIKKAYQDAENALQIRDTRTAETARKQAQEETEENKIEDNERPKKKEAKRIDYSDPEARRKLYNEIIAAAGDDPKTQLDAAKVIEQTQRDDKQAARERKTVVFFTPTKCFDCQLYQKAQERQKKS